MMNDKISRLGLLFIIVGFFMLCVSYAIENFDILYSVDPGYLSALGGFTLTTGMLILAITGTFYILRMLIKLHPEIGLFHLTLISFVCSRFILSLLSI